MRTEYYVIDDDGRDMYSGELEGAAKFLGVSALDLKKKFDATKNGNRRRVHGIVVFRETFDENVVKGRLAPDILEEWDRMASKFRRLRK